MSKYRLCYIGYGGYKRVDLDKIDCLGGKKVTDIKIIDEFTTSFQNEKELLDFLKRNLIIPYDVNKLYITVDETKKGITYNKKIFNGDMLFFEKDKEFLNLSYIYKWIMNNKNDSYLVSKICDNYMDKYKNAFNRITGSSYILPIFDELKALSRKNALKNLPSNDMYKIEEEFEKYISDFILVEFYKLDKDILKRDKKFVKKIDKNGVPMKSYRNIHDFINLIKTLGYDFELKQNKTREFVCKEQEIEKPTLRELYYETNEEYLTEEDKLRNVKQMLNLPLKKEIIDGLKPKTDSYFEPYVDGNDYIAPQTKEVIEETFMEDDRCLTLRYSVDN